MLFVRRESFRGYIRLYPITAIILLINIIVFMLDQLLLDRELTVRGMFYQEPVFNRYGMEEAYRYLTSIALHADVQHLLFNCFSTIVFAPPLERLLGHFRYMVFYLFAGIGGNVMSAFMHLGTEHGAVGASGAIYGVFGAYLFLALFYKSALDEASRKTVYTTLIFGMIYSVLVPNIDIWGHVGGAITGVLFMVQWVLIRGNDNLRARLRSH